jgi:transcriptional regulator with XRE-family HTH domain
MGKRKVRSLSKKLTEAERIRHQRIRAQIEQEKPELIAHGRLVKQRHARLREAIGALKASREALGLSLTDMKARTGIEKGNLSRLENAPNPNPTIDTLTRYANAVGKEVVITLVDKTASS